MISGEAFTRNFGVKNLSSTRLNLQKLCWLNDSLIQCFLEGARSVLNLPGIVPLARFVESDRQALGRETTIVELTFRL
ncbi:uncharacterized protein G2W53_019418 [Senna tora]|uniref:Uncharacterized protein n=1 Tax=Senna tora TaxID=362788 RepID=A0A834U223_9FABA|nr:uncharacterized protein G2W53_019418 [Senna tora]